MAKQRVISVKVSLVLEDDAGVQTETVILDKKRMNGFGPDLSFNVSRPLVPEGTGFVQSGPIVYELRVDDWTLDGKFFG